MKKLLIVVDMQKDFVDGALGTHEALKIVNNAVNKINNFNGDIILTLDTHNQDYLETKEGRCLPVIHCVKGTTGWQLNEKIAAALENKSYTTVEKLTFGSTGLPELIKEKAGESDFEITLIGLCTDICVVSNALILKANFPEKQIKVYEKACAGVTPESHEAALSTMRMCQIDVI